MDKLQVFVNTQFGQIRTMTDENNEVWFVGKDVAEVLGYKNGRDAIKNHVDDEDRADVAIHDGSQNRDMTIINESGLYSLVFSSKLPSAKQFKHWVTSEVLPSIRKTGKYEMPEKVTLKEEVECVEIIARMLNVNEAGKLTMLEGLYKTRNIPTTYLPKYELNGSREIKSATELLKRIESPLNTRNFNLIMMDKGLLEERTRPSSKGDGKERRYKALTEKGLEFGENAISPQNPRETQPLYYSDSFEKLVEQIME